MLIAGIILLIPAISRFTAWICFEKFPATTAKTGGWLKVTKHKKNITLYEIKPHGSWHKSGFLKNLTKAKYTYTVSNKTYHIRYDSIGTPNQTPKLITIVYLKKCPRLAYIASSALGYTSFLVDSILFFFHATILIAFSVYCFPLI